MSATNTKELIEELRVQANQHPCDADLIQFDIAATALEQLEARCAELERECETWKTKHAVLADKCGEPDSYKCVVYDLQDAEGKIRNRLVSLGWTPPNHDV
jgi:hypothetical protein